MRVWFKILCLCTVTLWCVTVWMSYFDAKGKKGDTSAVEDHQHIAAEDLQYIPANYELSDQFWAWEAHGQLNLIDTILDFKKSDDLKKTAQRLVELQNKAYGVDIKTPKILFMALRGEANGLYVPADKTMYLNSKMNWNDLPFERFAEVVLHENMHHILTHSGIEHGDFEYLSTVGFRHHDFAMDHKSLNPQEYVAYRTQRAGRYAGLNHQNLSVWEMSARTQEIRAIKQDVLD